MSDPVSFVLDAQNDAYQRGALPIWTVYDHPADYPDAFVARMFEVAKGSQGPTKVMLRSPDIEALRTAFIHAGLTRMPREDGDEPQIVESWV